jgi:hypothetical protein
MADEWLIKDTYNKSNENWDIGDESLSSKTVWLWYAWYKWVQKANDYVKYGQYGLKNPSAKPGVFQWFKEWIRWASDLNEKASIKHMQEFLKDPKLQKVVQKKWDKIMSTIYNETKTLLQNAKKTWATDDVLAKGTEIFTKNLKGIAPEAAEAGFKALVKKGTPGVFKVLGKVAGTWMKTAGKLLGPIGLILGTAYDIYDTTQEANEGKLKKGRGIVRFLDKTLLGVLPNNWSMKSDEEIAKSKNVAPMTPAIPEPAWKSSIANIMPK